MVQPSAQQTLCPRRFSTIDYSHFDYSLRLPQCLVTHAVHGLKTTNHQPPGPPTSAKLANEENPTPTNPPKDAGHVATTTTTSRVRSTRWRLTRQGWIEGLRRSNAQRGGPNDSKKKQGTCFSFDFSCFSFDLSVFFFFSLSFSSLSLLFTNSELFFIYLGKLPLQRMQKWLPSRPVPILGE